ncbi:MAG TPA: 5'-nucleotidase C-terminal domain-containing protein, partial [Verrucomicrobiae bacterium]|nr:5'-nucleotidase C-terminal domain-containing protein [Verrucomicrobiae bacterium]
RDVDVILAGGSEALFANNTDHIRDTDVVASPYPAALTSASGEPVYVASTGPNYRYVGRLVLQFDTQGNVAGFDPVSGSYATDAIGVVATGSHAADSNVVAVINRLAGIIDAKDGKRFGATDVYINGARIDVRSEETNLGDLSADANLARGKKTDPATVVSVKNGGGILDSIGAAIFVSGETVHVPPLANPRVGKQAGEISQLDIENSLRFNNSLTLLTLTAQQLRDTVEWGVAGTNLPGQFIQSGGIAFSHNPSNAPMVYVRDTNGAPASILNPGQRVQSLVVTNADGSLDLVVDKGTLVGDPNRKFRAITIKFMAYGGDSYLALSQGTDKVDLAPNSTTTLLFDVDGAEQKALADYLTAIGRYSQPDTDASRDLRMQSLSARGDAVIAPGITRIAGPNPSVVLTFSTLPGKTYTIEARDSLDAPWTQSNQLPVTGDGKLKTLTDPSPGAAKRFYRVVEEN